MSIDNNELTKTRNSKNPLTLISWPVMAFLIIACTGSIAQLPAASEYGLGTIFIYLVPAVLFMIPVALISAELATIWDGGVFIWVAKAMGPRTGFQAIWLQWIQSVTLYPSLLAFAAASLAYAFGKPELSQNGFYTSAVILIIFWAATLIAFRGLKASAKLSSIGLILGTLIPGAALIILMFVWLTNGHPSAVALNISDIIPRHNDVAQFVLIIGTFIAFSGLEVNAVHIREMNNPSKNYPKGVALSVITIFIIYVLGTIAISVAVPTNKLNLAAGASQAFMAYADGFGFNFGGKFLSFLLAFGALAAAATWVVGPSRGLLIVGKQGYLPLKMQQVNKHDVQVPILIVQAIIVSFLALSFVFIPSVSKAFWVLQTITVDLYMLMYILMFISAWILRRKYPDIKRSFRTPYLPFFVIMGTLAAICAILIGFIRPAQLDSTVSPVLYAGRILIGILILSIPPQLIYKFRRAAWKAEQNSAKDDNTLID